MAPPLGGGPFCYEFFSNRESDYVKVFNPEHELEHGHGLELGLEPKRDIELAHGFELGHELEHGHRLEGAESSKNVLGYVLEV